MSDSAVSADTIAARVARRVLADSAAGDSAALATMPPRQRADFDVLALLTDEALADSARAYCQPLSDSTDAEVRKRLRARDGDGLAVVLFARADRATGAVLRVELVRRTPGDGQRGYIWDDDAQTLSALEWEGGRSAPEQYDMPAGTPAPRALRGLGRRLLALPCTGTPVRPR